MQIPQAACHWLLLFFIEFFYFILYFILFLLVAVDPYMKQTVREDCSSTHRRQAPPLRRDNTKRRYPLSYRVRGTRQATLRPSHRLMMSSACEGYRSKDDVVVAGFTCPKADSDATALFCCGFSDLKYCCDDPNSFFPYEYGYMWWLRWVWAIILLGSLRLVTTLTTGISLSLLILLPVATFKSHGCFLLFFFGSGNCYFVLTLCDGSVEGVGDATVILTEKLSYITNRIWIHTLT